MPPAPTRQLYINCKYMSIKKRRKTTKNYKNKWADYCQLAVRSDSEAVRTVIRIIFS